MAVFLEPQNISLKIEAFLIELQVLYLNYTWEKSSQKHENDNISFKKSSPGDYLTIYDYPIPKINKIKVQTAVESVQTQRIWR